MSPDSTASGKIQDGEEKGLLKSHQGQVLGHVVQGQTLDFHWVTSLTPETQIWLALTVGAVAQRRASKAHPPLTAGPMLQVLRNGELSASWKRSEVK